MSTSEIVVTSVGIILSFLTGFMLGRIYEFTVWTVRLMQG